MPSRRGFRWLPASAPPPDPRPVDPDAARARFAELCAADDQRISPATRSRLFEPDGQALATIVIWHGFTNAPSQFTAVAKALAAQGYRVLVPRQPYQGFADVLDRSLAKLTVTDLTGHVDNCLDIAAGFGDPVWVGGLSAGGVLAAWAATRREVRRAVLLAPLVAPKGVPLPVVRLLARFPRLVPRFYYWWDPRLKENLGHSPHAYPGFPLPGLVPYLQLAEALLDGAVAVEPGGLERVVLVTNPGDFAIRRDAARRFATTVFASGAGYYGEATVAAELGWWHDFVDPWSPHGGTTEQVLGVLRASFGVDDPAAGGVLVPPLVQRQPQ